MAVAELAHALQITVCRAKDAVGADDWLEYEGGDGLRPLELDRLLEVGERLFHRVPSALDAVIGVEHVHHASARVLVRPPTRIARRLDSVAARSVVRAVAGQDLAPPGDRARDLDRVLVGVRASKRQEHLFDT